MEQKDKKNNGKPLFIETCVLLVLFGAWIVAIYDLFSVRKYDIDCEIGVHRQNAKDITPYYQKLNSICGDIVYNMTWEKVDDNTKHNYFSSHYTKILNACDSMVTITTEMRPLFSDNEYEKIVLNDALLTVASEYFGNLFDLTDNEEKEVEQQLKNRFWKYIFDTGLKEGNLRGAEELDYLFRQLAELKIEIGNKLKNTSINLDSLRTQAPKAKDITGMDMYPFFELMGNIQRKQYLSTIEEPFCLFTISPMSKNLDIINAKIQPEYRKYTKVPFIDAYIPHDVIGKIIFSFFIFIFVGGFIWKGLSKIAASID